MPEIRIKKFVDDLREELLEYGNRDYEESIITTVDRAVLTVLLRYQDEGQQDGIAARAKAVRRPRKAHHRREKQTTTRQDASATEPAEPQFP
jgi:hypothetical protein